MSEELVINDEAALLGLRKETPSHAADANKASTASAFTNTLLSFFGIGLLTMPYGTRFVGVVGGPLLISLIAAITLYCFLLVVKTKNIYHARGRTEVNSLNALGSESFGRAGTYAVNFAIVANQIGTVAAYQQFIGTNLLHLFPATVNLPLSFWVMVWCAVLIPLCCIREMKLFGFTSFLGIASVVFTATSVLVYGALYPTGPPDPLPLGPNDLFLFLGIAAFGYAGIAVSINVENSMRTPHHFPPMVTMVFIAVTVVYCGFSVTAYLLYGNAIESVISCNIHGPLGEAVRAALVLQLTFSTPLNAHPLWATIEPAMTFAGTGRRRWWILSVVRGVVLLIIGALAFSIPYFGSFSNFIGAVAVSLVTWILPPMFHLKASGRNIWLPTYLMDFLCIAFGIAVTVSSATITIITLVQQIEQGGGAAAC